MSNQPHVWRRSTVAPNDSQAVLAFKVPSGPATDSVIHRAMYAAQCLLADLGVDPKSWPEHEFVCLLGDREVMEIYDTYRFSNSGTPPFQSDGRFQLHAFTFVIEARKREGLQVTLSKLFPR